MKTKDEIKEELFLKEKRVSYWEKFKTVPNTEFLIYYGNKREVQI